MSIEPPNPITRHLRITGRVQGVGYRWHLTQEALRLGVTGWVRNRLDGSVEAVVQGPAAAVLSLIDWAQHGPRLARVDEVAVTAVASANALAGFGQRETA